MRNSILTSFVGLLAAQPGLQHLMSKQSNLEWELRQTKLAICIQKCARKTANRLILKHRMSDHQVSSIITNSHDIDWVDVLTRIREDLENGP